MDKHPSKSSRRAGDPELPRNLTTAQAGEFLNLSARTIERWRLTGDGPRFVKLGKAVRYPRAELERFLAAAMRSSTSDPGPRA